MNPNDSMDDIFGQLAGQEQVEGGASFDDLPDKAWVLALTASEENGGAAPKVESFERKEGGTGYSFKTGVIAIGGDKLLDEAKHNGRYTFFQAYVHPKDDGADSGNVLSGRLLGFLNAVLSPGVGEYESKGLSTEDKKAKEKERALARWKNTLRVLQSAAKEFNITPQSYASEGQPPDVAVFLAATAREVMLKQRKPILVKTRTDRGKNKDRSDIVVGGFEDATQANVDDRKVKVFTPADESYAVALPSAAPPVVF